MYQSDLIYDIGMSQGNDTAFYLRKGFRVVGVEADPAIHDHLLDRFAEDVRSGRLHVESKAAGERTGEQMPFYSNKVSQLWSSSYVTHGVGPDKLDVYSVETIAWPELVERYGTPYYVKLDIEGAEPPFLRGMLGSKGRPPYLSCELANFEPVELMREMGYDRFRLINQTIPFPTPDPAREGVFVEPERSHWSGFFGRELPGSTWFSFREVQAIFIDFQKMMSYETVTTGWFDCHACNLQA